MAGRDTWRDIGTLLVTYTGGPGRRGAGRLRGEPSGCEAGLAASFADWLAPLSLYSWKWSPSMAKLWHLYCWMKLWRGAVGPGVTRNRSACAPAWCLRLAAAEGCAKETKELQRRPGE